MDTYTGVLEIIDMRSFSSAWYWIMVAVAWSTASHWVIGVPYDSVQRAKRRGEDAQLDLEQLVTLNVNRVLYIIDMSGIWIVGFAAFFLSGLGLLGFWYEIEICQAIFLLAAPMSVVAYFSVRAARFIRADETTGIALRLVLTRQRFLTQIIGFIAIFVTAFWGMWHNLNATVL